MRQQTDATILFFIKRTKLLKSGEAPIFLRLTINQERAEFGLKLSTLPYNWSEIEQMVIEGRPNSNEINKAIIQLEKRVNGIIEYLETEDGEITSRLVIDKIAGKKEKKHTILEVFNEHNTNAQKLVNIDFARGTIQRYETSYMHTKDFIKWQYHREDLPLNDLNQQFVKQYEFYLKTVRKCSHNTTVKYLRNFKKIVLIALANNWMKSDPFASVKYKLKQIDAILLTQEELDCIINKEITIPRIAHVRDIFLFCCFTGLAFADVKTLKKEHLDTDKEGITWIHKKRKKTDQLSTIYVIKAALKILKKYQRFPELQDKGYLLPVLSNQKMNAYLKEIADICGINKPITTHTARHTFATTIAMENNIPIEVVSKTLGHSNTRMTQRYAKTTEILIKNNMDKIKNLY